MVFMSRAVIFANGIIPDPAAALKILESGDFIIAADGGLRNAVSVGITPRVLIGDFDSLSPAEVDDAEKNGMQIIRFPPEKDETDLELAIRFAMEKQFMQVVVIGALGGRLDQTLGNIALLAAGPAGVDIRLDDGLEQVFVVRNRIDISGKPGDLVSLIPWGVAITGVTTAGLRYPLHEETLHPHMSRGISNEMTGEKATINFDQGLLVVIHTRT
jgi:thiamine pyrophosphokinase